MVLVLTCSCVPRQHRIDFDINTYSLISCDQSRLRHIRIMEKDGEGIGYEILLKMGDEGNTRVYLDQENLGYSSNTEYPIILKPNTEYLISSVLRDSGHEMRVFTNAAGRVDSVINPLGCINEE